MFGDFYDEVCVFGLLFGVRCVGGFVVLGIFVVVFNMCGCCIWCGCCGFWVVVSGCVGW